MLHCLRRWSIHALVEPPTAMSKVRLTTSTRRHRYWIFLKCRWPIERGKNIDKEFHHLLWCFLFVFRWMAIWLDFGPTRRIAIPRKQSRDTNCFCLFLSYTKSGLKRSPRFSRLSLATPFDGVFETPKSNSPKGLVGHCLLFWFFFFPFLIWPLNSFILFLLFHSFMSLSWRLVSLKQRVQLPPLPTLSVNGSRFWIVYQILFSLYFIWIVYANGIAWELPSSRSLAAEPLFFSSSSFYFSKKCKTHSFPCYLNI